MTTPVTPVRSMTGFGAAARETPALAVRAEAKSVNNRGLSVTVRGPAWVETAAAGAIEAAVKRHATRGTVSVHVQVTRRRDAAPARVVREVFADYAAQIAAAMQGTACAAPSAGDILRLPGVVEEAVPTALGADEAAVVVEAVEAALVAMVEMRDREGASLVAELRGLLDQMERGALAVETRAPAAVGAARDRLRERVAQLLAPAQTLPEEIVAREVAVLADKSDVAEEVARLRSHVAQTREMLASGGAVGRRLDFLAQEFGREVNTIGSKSQDTEIANLVVDMKVAVERLKEQAANLE